MMSHEFLEELSRTNPVAEIFSWNDAAGWTHHWHVSFMHIALERAAELGFRLDAARHHLTLQQCKDALRLNEYAKELAPERIGMADIRKSVFAVTLFNERTQREEALIVDGWHRIARFVEVAKPEDKMPMIWWNREQTEMFEMPEVPEESIIARG